MRNEASEPRDPGHDDEVDEQEVESVERGDADAKSRREEVERAAEREEQAGEG
jgi:hypothetical protein